MAKAAGKANEQYVHPQMEVITITECVVTASECILENAGDWVNSVDGPAE